MKKSILILTSVLGMFVASSCAKQLEVTPPNKIYDEQIQDLMENGSTDQKNLVLNAIASPFAKYLNYWAIDCGSTGALAPMTYCYQGIEWARTLQGNDVVTGESNGTTNGLAGTAYYEGSANFANASDVGNAAHWFGYAYGLNQANLLLSYMSETAAKNSDSAADGRVRGLVVRAYSYMRLTEEYCKAYLDGGKEGAGMSLYTVYDPGQSPVARSTGEETWNFIISDLKEAVQLCKDHNVGYTTAYDSLEDFDLGLCQYLLGLAYVETGQWAAAASVLSELVNSGAYSFIAEANYGGHNEGTNLTDDAKFYPEKNAFTGLQVNPEVIFGYIKTSSYNPVTQANLAHHFSRLANPFGTYSASGSTARIDDQLYNKIDANDFRKDAFYTEAITNFNFKGNSPGRVCSYSALKYAANYGIQDGGAGHSDESLVDEVEFCKFRYSDAVLLLAEAYAQNNDATNAKKYLNLLLKARTKSGAPTLTCDNYSSMAGMTALQMVQLQYRIEMWGENGREYFNNKRWGISVNRSASNVHWAKSYTLTPDQMILNIPQKEVENNPYL